MISFNERYILVFNGEIYNYKDLAQQLYLEGIYFEVTGDTRVLLEACVHWGIKKTLPKLNGMFAFGLYDKVEKTLVVARDRFGEKPLYYTYDGHRFAFASELKALKVTPQFDLEVDREALGLYLRFNYIPCPYSIYKNCKKLFPGHYLMIRDGKFEDRCYYNLENVFKTRTLSNLSEAEIIDVLDEKIKEAVKNRMICDVPIGAFLSGGIDSSLLVALMQNQSSAPVKTFTVGFKDNCYDESKYAEAIAKHLKTDHTMVYIPSEELWGNATEAVDAYDEPFGDASAIGTYVISKHFKEHVSVAIGGDGGDELFLGYYRHKWLPYLFAAGKAIPNFLLKICEKTNDAFFSCKAPILQTKIRKGIRSLQAKSFLEAYLNSVSYWPVEVDFSNTWFCASEDLANDAEHVAYLDLRTFLHDDVLCKVDRASMAVSLETRTPFLDYELAEFALSIPLKHKLKKRDKKHLLKCVLNRYLPQQLWDRPKMGFGMPLDQALRTSLKEDFEHLLKKDTIIWQYLDKTKVRNLWNEHVAHIRNYELLLWNFYVAQRFLTK